MGINVYTCIYIINILFPEVGREKLFGKWLKAIIVLMYKYFLNFGKTI